MKNARCFVVGTELATKQKLLKYATVLGQEHSITPDTIFRYKDNQTLLKLMLLYTTHKIYVKISL